MSQPPQQSTVNFNQFFHECYELSRQAKNEDDFLVKARKQLGEMVERLIQCTVGDKVEKMVESRDGRPVPRGTLPAGKGGSPPRPALWGGGGSPPRPAP